MFVRHQLHLAGRMAELHHRLDELALGLQIDAVVIETDDALHGTREHLVLGVHASAFVEQLDV